MSFSSQTFAASYWLKRPALLAIVFQRINSCSCLRQIARELDVAPSTIQLHAERLGRHCLLFQEHHRPRGPIEEPLAVDGFESFEFGQDYPLHLHVVVGADSHFHYAFSDSPLRRKGRMTPVQKRRRAHWERIHGRPDPRSIEKEMAEAVRLAARAPQKLTIRSDDHRAYPRAFRRLEGWQITHEVTSSRAPRTPSNPLFPVNLLDLLIRHGGAHHKRETIAFAKRRQAVVERMAILQVWRNFLKSVSERKQNATPAQRLGLVDRKLRVEDVLGERLFASRERPPQRLMHYYRREVVTLRIPNGRRHTLRYAF